MSKNKILIVEDDNDIREVYKLVLQHNGYEVCTANNGEQGLKELDECDPRLVLLDIFMPVMDGEAFLKRANLKNYPGMSVVVCSNTSDQDLMNNMLKLGAKKVVTKSTMAPDDLAELVRPYMKN